MTRWTFVFPVLPSALRHGATVLALLAALIRPAPTQTISTPPQSQSAAIGASITFSVTASGSNPLSYQWQHNGTALNGANSATLMLADVQPANVGIYTVVVTSGATSVTSSAILGLTTAAKLVGLGTEFANIFHPGTGYTYDQILLGGAAASVTADPGQILRLSYVDLTDDIVQVEFSGPGTLSLSLDNPSGPAAPANYNQPGVSYMKGHGSIVIAGATENTQVTVFSVGSVTSSNAALFPAGMTFDGVADLAYLAILGVNGKFGGIRTANTSFFAAKGLTGIYAPGVQVGGPVYVGDIDAFSDSRPVLVFGSTSEARITGGDLRQTNGQAVTVSGLALLNYAAGLKSNGAALPIQTNQARLVENGLDITTALARGGPTVHEVRARQNATDPNWRTYLAKTIDTLPGFNFSADPGASTYGGWKVSPSAGTGFFRVEKRGNRWWIVDPDGYPFIHKGVAVFRPGTSRNQRAALASQYRSNSNWVKVESGFLRQNGFNGAGAWSDADLIHDNQIPLVYSIIVNPMGSYRAEHIKQYGGVYPVAGWQGYRYDLAMVFDPEFDAYVEKSITPIAKYANDKFLLGYYTDNELPWKNDALDRHLNFLGKTEAGYLAAKKWLDDRKGKDTSMADVNAQDRLAFTGFYLETYLRKVAAVIRKYDPNHLYLGCRFNQETEELNNPEMFRVAGKYMDIVSINHYRKWEPVQSIMANWETWSAKPFLITEWYVKGEDSGLPNKSGAGWNVPTQQDRGYFYQNFTIELLKSRSCVGWHWFTYQDNDPEDLTTDPSNRDSNKGIVNTNYEPYQPLIENMKQLNDHTFELIQYLDRP